MTDYGKLRKELPNKLATLPLGRFRLTDLVDNPPAGLGRVFRDDVVVKKIYPNIKRIDADDQSIIYEKF